MDKILFQILICLKSYFEHHPYQYHPPEEIKVGQHVIVLYLYHLSLVVQKEGKKTHHRNTSCSSVGNWSLKIESVITGLDYLGY